MIETYKSIKKINQPEKFKKWVRRVLINKSHRIYRRKYRKDISIDESNMNSLSTNNINDIESNLNFYDVIKNLKYEERIIVVLYYMEDYSVKEIKDILKMNENTIDFAEKIKNALNLKDKYKLDSINEISSFSESNDEKRFGMPNLINIIMKLIILIFI